MVNKYLLDKYYDGSKKWVPTLIFCTLFFLSYLPPKLLPFKVSTWYIFLSCSLFIYFIGNYRINVSSVKFLIIILSFHLFGAFTGVFNSYDFSLAFRGFLGLCIQAVTYITFLPLMSSPFLRRCFLGVIILVSLIWVFEIFIIRSSVAFMSYSTFGKATGANKNWVSFLLAVSSITCLYFAIFANNKTRFKIVSRHLFSSRIFFLLLSIIIFFSQALLYSKSSFLTYSLGLVIIICLIIAKSDYKIISIKVLSVFSVLFFAIYGLSSTILKTAPGIIIMYEKIKHAEREELFVGRQFLIKKGLELIKNNPIIGIGIGGSKARTPEGDYSDKSAHIHNAYLTEWVDKGIFGLIAYIVWIVIYLNFFKKNYNILTTTDKAWMIINGMTFFHLNFKDMNSFAFIMLITFCGIKNNYEQIVYFQKKIQKNDLNL